VHVKLQGAGTAQWETPYRTAMDEYSAAYSTKMVFRFTFDDGRAVHVKGRFGGLDHIKEDGTVYGGFGLIDGLDQDGDRLIGRIDWIVRGDYEAADLSFSDGTGKWKGVAGRFEAPIWAMPGEHDQPMPPTDRITFWGFMEGEGELDLPNFEG
jgi:hypothetical protein